MLIRSLCTLCGWWNILFVLIRRGATLKLFVPESRQLLSILPASGIAAHTLKISVCAQRWKTLCQYSNTHACKPNKVSRTTKLPHRLCLHAFAFRGVFPCLWTEEATGPLAALIFSCCSPFFFFFFCSDVYHSLPQLFYQVILSGRQPRTAALFILCYGDRGIGSPDHRFDDMQRQGKDSATFTSAVTSASPDAVIINLNTGAINWTVQVRVVGLLCGRSEIWESKWLLRCVCGRGILCTYDNVCRRAVNALFTCVRKIEFWFNVIFPLCYCIHAICSLKSSIILQALGFPVQGKKNNNK